MQRKANLLLLVQKLRDWKLSLNQQARAAKLISVHGPTEENPFLSGRDWLNYGLIITATLHCFSFFFFVVLLSLEFVHSCSLNALLSFMTGHF